MRLSIIGVVILTAVYGSKHWRKVARAAAPENSQNSA